MANDYLRYRNQGATRSQGLSEDLARRLSYLQGMGVQAEVFSGGQPGVNEGGSRVGSTRHDHGNAADVFFYKDGKKLDWGNPEDLPIFNDIVSKGRAAGITGFGAGQGYMQPGSMHIGMGNPGVWGAGGKSDNAPDWLRTAFNGSPSPSANDAMDIKKGFDPVGDVMASSGKPSGGLVSFGTIGPTNTSQRPESAPIVPSNTAVPAAVMAQANPNAENKDGKLAGLFNLLAQVNSQQEQTPQPAQIQGPTPQQSQALAMALQSIRGRLV